MKRVAVLTLLFVLGFVAGAIAAKRTIDPNLYKGKEKAEAGKTLLSLARVEAGKGSWENIAVGRAYLGAGMQEEAQVIFDSVTARGAEASDWLRIGRAYFEAGDWDQAKAAFEKVMTLTPKNAKRLAEIGGYYNIQGDREKAEALFQRSLELEPREFWSLVNIAGSYFDLSWR